MELSSSPDQNEEDTEPNIDRTLGTDHQFPVPSRSLTDVTELPTSLALDSRSAEVIELAKDDNETLEGELGEDPSELVDLLLYPESDERPEASDANPLEMFVDSLLYPENDEESAREPSAVGNADNSVDTARGSRPDILQSQDSKIHRFGIGAAFVEASTEAVGSAEAAETAERPETKGPIAEMGSRVIKVGDISDERLRQWAERRGLESMTVKRMQQLKRDRFGKKVRVSEAYKAKKKAHDKEKRRRARVEAARARDH